MIRRFVIYMIVINEASSMVCPRIHTSWLFPSKLSSQVNPCLRTNLYRLAITGEDVVTYLNVKNVLCLFANSYQRLADRAFMFSCGLYATGACFKICMVSETIHTPATSAIES